MPDEVEPTEGDVVPGPPAAKAASGAEATGEIVDGVRVSDYPERPSKEAQDKLMINPANPDHQAKRLAETSDYIEGEIEGYAAPEYGKAV